VFELLEAVLVVGTGGSGLAAKRGFTWTAGFFGLWAGQRVSRDFN